jgi:hypothetical protein
MTDKKPSGWEMWHREETLIDHRLNWLGIATPLIFLAYFFVGTVSATGAAVVAFFGLLVSAAIAVGVVSAIIAQCYLYKTDDDIDTFGVHWLTTIGGWVPPIGISGISVVAWLALRGDWWGISTAVFSISRQLATGN